LNDIDKVTTDQLKALDWDDAFSDANIESPALSPAEITSIEDTVGHEPMSEPVVEVEAVAADTTPEADSYINPADEIEKQMGIKAPDMENIEPASKGVAVDTVVVETVPDMVHQVAAEVSPTVALEKSTQAFVTDQLHETWAPDKMKAFLFMHQNEMARLIEKPIDLQTRIQEFKDAIKSTTDQVVNGKLAKAHLEGSHTVQGADGKIYLIDQAQNKKDQWLLWKVKDNGEFEKIQDKQGIFRKKMTDTFNGKTVKRLLGYVKDRTEERLRGISAQPPF